MSDVTNPPSASSDTPPNRYDAALAQDHRAALAGLVGRAPHVRDAEHRRPAGRRRAGRRARREAVRARHVPVSVGQRTARGAPPRLHRHRRVRPLQAHDRPQRAARDGLRRLRPARRAVRRGDRPAPEDHDRSEHRHLPTPAPPARPGPRSAAQRVDHRSRVLPLDPVDLQPGVQRLVRPRPRSRPPDRRVDRRVRVGHPSDPGWSRRGPS